MNDEIKNRAIDLAAALYNCYCRYERKEDTKKFENIAITLNCTFETLKKDIRALVMFEEGLIARIGYC